MVAAASLVMWWAARWMVVVASRWIVGAFVVAVVRTVE